MITGLFFIPPPYHIIMAMPMDYNGMRTDEAAERQDDPSDYKRTCIDFIHDISGDYKAWVDYYKLPPDEDRRRRTQIDAVISRTCEWIAKIATSIKSIDVVMNDGIQKMAEATAGKPFQIGVFVNGMSGYAFAKPGMIDVVLKATGRPGCRTRLGYHFKDDRFRIESTCGAQLDESGLETGEFEMLSTNIQLDARTAAVRDVISFTITVVETRDGSEYDKRGVSTIVHVT